MFPYMPNSSRDEEKMLKEIGVASIDELFADIPENVRFNRELNIGNPMSEYELAKYMRQLGGKNKDLNELVSFLGAGAYDHYIPSTVGHVTSRSEFYTAYTPYQPEISQGTLQAIFEYQTMIASLTGMDVANASMYDGASAVAEAAFMAVDTVKKRQIVVSKTVHPEARRVLQTYMKFNGIEVIEIDHLEGATDIEKLRAAVSADTAGVIVQNPNFFGIIEDVAEFEKITHSTKAQLIVSVDPISLGILKSPGELGADIVVGEGQALGNSLNFGGPYLGFMAVTKKHMRRIPGRVVGQTEDVDGKRGFVLTLQTREQHIRREKATSNICSNQALNALAANVYLTTMGKQGIREVAEQIVKKAHYAFNEITKSGKYKAAFNKPFFKEFAIVSELENQKINDELMENGILGGYDLSRDYSDLKNTSLYCVTEKRNKGEIDKLAAVLEGIR